MKLLNIIKRNKQVDEELPRTPVRERSDPDTPSDTGSSGTGAKKRLLIIVGGVTAFALGFALMGILIPSVSRKQMDTELKAVRHDSLPGISQPSGGNLPAPPPQSTPENQSAKPSAGNKTEPLAQPNTVQTQTVTVQRPAPAAESAGPVPSSNPFSYDYDREFARKKLDLLKELEIEKIRAEIREAQQRGKEKKNDTVSKAVSLPKIDKIQPVQSPINKDIQQFTQPHQPVQTVVKIRVPGYTGVYITAREKTVVLDDGNRYKQGDYVSDYLYIDEISSTRDIYVRDRLGNRFKLKPLGYETQIVLR